MADLSLDDYIGKSNFKVKINNQPQAKRGLQTKGFANRNANRGRSGGKMLITSKLKQETGIHARLGVARTNDARSKINKPSDARAKITSKQLKKGTFDARQMIGQKSQPKRGFQMKKITAPTGQQPQVTVSRNSAGLLKQTVRVNLSPQKRAGGNVNVNNGLLMKTVRNEDDGGTIQMRNMNLKITKPFTETSFDENPFNIKITKPVSAMDRVSTSSRGPVISIKNDISAPKISRTSSPLRSLRTSSPLRSASSQDGRSGGLRSMSGLSANDRYSSGLKISRTTSGLKSASSGDSNSGGLRSMSANERYNSGGFKISRTTSGLRSASNEDSLSGGLRSMSANERFSGGMRSLPVSGGRSYVSDDDEDDDQFTSDYGKTSGKLTFSVSQKPNPVNRTSVSSPVERLRPGMKRKSGEMESSGPLKFTKSSTKYVPVLRMGGGDDVPVQTQTPEPDFLKKLKMKPEEPPEEYEEVVEEVNSVDGYKVLITNLHSVVSQDDIIELFGAVGALKKAKLVKPGIAEVVYLNKDDAYRAEQKYHTRELDSQPMHVKVVVPQPKIIEKPKTASQPLQLGRDKTGRKNTDTPGVELSLIHKALFKTEKPSSAKPVSFTVKI